MFEEFKVGRTKRSVACRFAEDDISFGSKCFVSGGGGGGDGGGGSTQSTSTSYNSNIPEYAQPYVTSMLNATTQQLFDVQDGQIQGFAPYVPYSANPADYVAGFSPMQQQSFQSAANLQTPKQFGVASDLASTAGEGALGTTQSAMGYGELGSRYGAVGARIGEGALGYGGMGAGYGAQGALTGQQALGYGGMGAGYGMQAAQSGNQYAQQATNPNAVQSYMSPYQQAAIDVQKQEANRAFDIQTQQRNAAAAKSGAFGGSRQGIEQAEAQRNLNQQLQNIQATGNQAAYDRAIQSMQYGSGLNLQGLQAGIQGTQAALQGVQGAQAGYGMGIQGAQTGLQGIQGALAGTAQGMQGAQIGLQGVQGAQAGYGLANQAAGTMGQLGTQQLAAQQSIINQQNTLGAQQQQNQQQIINQAIQDYANAQQYPLMQLGTMSNMLRGLPLQSSTTQQYVAQPNTTTQAIGAFGTAGSLYKAMGSKKGGIIDAKKMAKGGITSYDVGGSVRAKLYEMEPEQLKGELDSPSAEVRKMARGILMEKQVQGKAGGGIIAFSGGTPDPEIIPAEPAPQQTATDTQYQATPAPAPVPQQAAPAPAPAPVGPGRRDSAAAGIMKADPKSLATTLAQQAISAGDQSIDDIYAGLQKGRAPDTARQEYRSKIMEERANARDEDSRQNWLRAAQFFSSWGSLPGNTLAAGLTAMKGIIPDVMSDRKEQKKYMREIDKTLYSLDEAARLEQNGLWDKAAELKQKLGEEKYKVLGPLSTMYSADVHAAATRAATAASSGRETDMKARYNVKLEELTNGDPSKATPTQKAQAMEWASNITLPGQKLDYKRVEDTQKAISDSEKGGTISNLEKSRRIALVQAGTADEKKAVNEDYDRRITEAKQDITNRIMQGNTPAPAASAAPATASHTNDSVTVGSQTYTRPETFTDAQWKAYKKSVGAS